VKEIPKEKEDNGVMKNYTIEKEVNNINNEDEENRKDNENNIEVNQSNSEILFPKPQSSSLESISDRNPLVINNICSPSQSISISPTPLLLASPTAQIVSSVLQSSDVESTPLNLLSPSSSIPQSSSQSPAVKIKNRIITSCDSKKKNNHNISASFYLFNYSFIFFYHLKFF
jgi:hypothetical protein